MPLAATVMSSSPVWPRSGCRRCPALSPELLVFLGSFDKYTAPTIFGVFGILLSAGYITWTVQRVFFGPKNERWAELPDANSGGRRCRWLALVIVDRRRRRLRPSLVIDVLETRGSSTS